MLGFKDTRKRVFDTILSAVSLILSLLALVSGAEPANAKEEVGQLIIIEAKRQDADPILALAISHSESRFRNVPNEAGLSSAYGPFQILESTFLGNCKGSRKVIEDNIKCGVYLLKRDGWTHWRESLPYWFPIYTKAYIEWSHIVHGI